MSIREAHAIADRLIRDAGTVTDHEVKAAERVLAGSDWNKEQNLEAWHIAYDAKVQRGIED